MRRPLGILVAALVAASAAAVVVVAVLATREEPTTARTLPRGRAVTASGTLFPATHVFGAPVRVRIEAVVDRRRVDPDKVRLRGDFAPYEIVSQTRTQRDVGPLTRLRYRLVVRCLRGPCLPRAGGINRFELGQASLGYPGHPRAALLDWPTLSTVARVDPVDLQLRAQGVTRIGRNETRVSRQPLPPWRADATRLDDPTYRLAPTTLFWLALAGALLLVVAAAAALRPYLPHVPLPWRRREPLPLERALAVLERARATGAAAEQRKALELLAAELRRSGEGELALSARELAWSARAPVPDATGALTVDVRRAIEERSNGHG